MFVSAEKAFEFFRDNIGSYYWWKISFDQWPGGNRFDRVELASIDIDGAPLIILKGYHIWLGNLYIEARLFGTVLLYEIEASDFNSGYSYVVPDRKKDLLFGDDDGSEDDVYFNYSFYRMMRNLERRKFLHKPEGLGSFLIDDLLGLI